MGEYTYLLGLAIVGVVMFTVGMIAAGKERRAHLASRVLPSAARDDDERRSSHPAHA